MRDIQHMYKLYKLVITSKAEKQLKKLPREIEQKLRDYIDDLPSNPKPRNYKKLSTGYYRIRKGTYRIIYDIINDVVTIKVVAVGHLRNIYKPN